MNDNEFTGAGVEKGRRFHVAVCDIVLKRGANQNVRLLFLYPV